MPRFFDKFIEHLDAVEKGQVKEYFYNLILENKFLEGALIRLKEGILLLDKSGSVKSMNAQAELLLGVPLKKANKIKFDQCPFDTQIIKVLKGAISSDRESVLKEIITTFPKEQILRISACTIKNKEEDIGWVIELNDITELKKSDLERIHTEKLKALVTLAAGIAHELGNPLNSLGIHLQLIGRELKKLPSGSRGKLVKQLSTAQDEIKRLDKIITGFLQTTRPLKPKFSVAHVHNLLDETLLLLGPEIKKNRIRIEKRYHADIPKIYMDYVQLKQAFINVIKNAVEAMPDGGTLKITTSFDEKFIKIFFRDSGVGISKSELQKIFEPYYTTKTDGYGLGLMTVHRIIAEHGGRIDIKSDTGKGTLMAVYLPIEPVGPRLLTADKKSGTEK